MGGAQNPGIQFESMNMGFRNFFSGIFGNKETESKTFDHSEASSHQEYVAKNIMAGTFWEFIIGIGGVLAIFLVYPHAFDFLKIQLSTPVIGMIYKIILGIFCVGFYFILRNLTILNYEYSNLCEVFKKSRSVSQSEKKKIYFAAFMPSNQYGIVFDKIDAIMRMYEEKPDVPHASLADILYTRESVRDDLPNFLASALPMVGLIGTILGLSGATAGMEALIGSVGDYQALKSGLNQTLSGVGMAFYTTLFGAVGMLILRYFNVVVRKARLVFLTELEEVVVSEIIPKLSRVCFK
tara:strand:- start:6991 stop:7875 length:885 start_codon:yes stop_codon:yes gene_type:complete